MYLLALKLNDRVVLMLSTLHAATEEAVRMGVFGGCQEKGTEDAAEFLAPYQAPI